MAMSLAAQSAAPSSLTTSGASSSGFSCARCAGGTTPKCSISEKKKLKKKKDTGNACQCCTLCVQCREFNGQDDADIKSLVEDVGLGLLQFQHADPTTGAVAVEEQIDDVVEAILLDWRSVGTPIEMMPPMKAKLEKSDVEEKQVHKMFREKVEAMKNVGIFPGYKAGPLISKSKFGENLDNILRDPGKRDIFLKAFNLNVDLPPQKGWRWQINKNDRREKDLVLVLGDLSVIAQVEVKGGNSQGNVEEQFQTFRDYLERSHGTYLQDLSYVPVLAKHTATKTSKQFCEKYELNIKSSTAEFELWWHHFIGQEFNSEISQEKFEDIVKRFIMMSSLVLTSLPMEITMSTPDSHLIVLRPEQWKLLWNTPSNYALIHGTSGTGKSMALELGLALVCPRIRYRCLVSLEEFGNAQNVLREDFFEGTDLSFLYSNEQNESPLDILERLLADVPTTTDSFICIDNLKAEDLQSESTMRQIKKLVEMDTVKFIWIVVDGGGPASFEECQNLGFIRYNFD